MNCLLFKSSRVHTRLLSNRNCLLFKSTRVHTRLFSNRNCLLFKSTRVHTRPLGNRNYLLFKSTRVHTCLLGGVLCLVYNVARVSRLSIFDCTIGFLWCLFSHSDYSSFPIMIRLKIIFRILVLNINKDRSTIFQYTILYLRKHGGL